MVPQFLTEESFIFAIVVSAIFFCYSQNIVYVSAQRTSITHITANLSQSRDYLAATSSGELVFFGGGYNATGPSDRVDIYHVTSGSWTSATLSVPRGQLAATSVENLVFFAGGTIGKLSQPLYSNQVDIYSTLDGSWSTGNLSQSRSNLAATSVGNLALFGGGQTATNLSDIVDIYNVTNNMWTTATLSQARSSLAATSVASQYALFAGGYDGLTTSSNVVDIYDSWNEIWSTATLSQGRELLAATSVGSLAFFGGGQTTSGNSASNVVDIFNSTSQTWSTATLSQSRTNLAAASIGDIVAFGGGMSDNFSSVSIVDMYNVTSGIWFNATLSQPRSGVVATSLANDIFFGGGSASSSNLFVVDIFCLDGGCLLLQNPILATANLSAPTGPSIHPVSSSAEVSVVVGVVFGVAVPSVGGGILFVIIIIKRRKYKKKQPTETSLSHSDANTQNLATIEQQQQQHDQEQRQGQSEQKVQQKEQTSTSFSISGGTYDSREASTKEHTTTDITRSESEFATSTQRTLKHSHISFNEIVIEKKLGSGSYGKVCLGKWNAAPVALKFCKKKGKVEDFMKEIELMIELPPHPNVVQLFGVSFDGPHPVIIMEYCAGGSLDSWLFDSEDTIPEEHKMKLIRGIAAGMLHLHKYNVVHRDLAARNILLTASGDPKISDFGMSRILKETQQGKTYNSIGPIRWMAPESLAQQTYSKKSDVWSFGIVVWEIFAQSEPHLDVDPIDVGTLIRDKFLTPEIPSDCPEKLRQLMEMCWNKDPEKRPSFEAICQILEQ
jgi:predicted Ser/Thr protein kinase